MQGEQVRFLVGEQDPTYHMAKIIIKCTGCHITTEQDSMCYTQQVLVIRFKYSSVVWGRMDTCIHMAESFALHLNLSQHCNWLQLKQSEKVKNK